MKAVSRILAYEGLALIAFGILAILFATETILFALIAFGAGLVCLVISGFTGGISIKDRLMSRGTKYGTNAVIYSTVILGLLVAVNYIGVNHDKEWDLTGIKSNTLSDQTLKLLGSLDQKVKVTAFFKAGEDQALSPLLERYARVGNRFEFAVVDPDLNPEAVKGYNVTQRGEIVVESGARNTIITGQTEEDITNAIIKVSKKQQGAIYFLKGHGEIPLDSKEERGYMAVKLGLENENYVVKELLLETLPDVPADCQALVIAGPIKVIGERELGAIARYLEQGGRALIMLDPQTQSGLEQIVAMFGITVNNDIIVDQQVRMFEGATLGIDPVVQDFSKHEITEKFDQPVVFSQARSLIIDAMSDPMLTVDALARTGETSWGESDISLLFDKGVVDLDEVDKPGPLVVAAAATRVIPDEANEQTDLTQAENIKAKLETRLVVVGDSDFAGNANINYFYNGVLLLNMVHWLSGEDYLVAVPPRSYAPATIYLTEKDSQMVFLASVFLIPQIVLMLGIGTILRRRGR